MDYIVGSDIELTDLEINMLKGHGFKVWELDKMSKEELEDAQNWLESNMGGEE